MVICHGGPISQPADAAYIIENVPGIDGFFGATSIERLAAEKGIREQTEAFKGHPQVAQPQCGGSPAADGARPPSRPGAVFFLQTTEDADARPPARSRSARPAADTRTLPP